MIVVIIPTYNEASNISKVIKNVFCLNLKDLNILVVDDSSPDGTSKIVKKIIKKNKNLHLLINEEKKGLGKAYMVGMDYAINQLNAKVLVEMDADLSHDTKI